MTKPLLIEPGSRLGIFGGGQLGRMFASSAARLGYHVIVFCPDAHAPAAELAEEHIRAEYHDVAQVTYFAQSVSVITYEFENIPLETVRLAHNYTAVYPQPDILQKCQHRSLEKQFLKETGFATAPFVCLSSDNKVSKEEFLHSIQVLGLPCILKTATQGYDGKGQYAIHSLDEAGLIFDKLENRDYLLEGFVDFALEVSVVVARGSEKETVSLGPIENHHLNHILDLSVCPAALAQKTQENARKVAMDIADSLGLVGVICVEMFITKHGEIIVNEIAPRPHNSGHLSIEACASSQFEQQLRTICGLPLGSFELRKHAAMANLLGDLWSPSVPQWSNILGTPECSLHLYGKLNPQKGRKMGHITCLADSADRAKSMALSARALLQTKRS